MTSLGPSRRDDIDFRRPQTPDNVFAVTEPVEVGGPVTDPARALLVLFESWTTPSGTSIASTRGISPGDPDGWLPMESAVRLLGEVRLGIRTLRSAGREMNRYEKYFPTWASAVFLVNTTFVEGQQATRESVTEPAMDMLSALSDQFKAFGYPGVVPDGESDQIREAVDELRQFIAGLTSIAPQARAFINALCDQLERALDEVRGSGMLNVRRLSAELYGLLQEFGDATSDPTERKSWDEWVGTEARKLLTWTLPAIAAGPLGEFGMHVLRSIGH